MSVVPLVHDGGGRVVASRAGVAGTPLLSSSAGGGVGCRAIRIAARLLESLAELEPGIYSAEDCAAGAALLATTRKACVSGQGPGWQLVPRRVGCIASSGSRMRVTGWRVFRVRLLATHATRWHSFPQWRRVRRHVMRWCRARCRWRTRASGNVLSAGRQSRCRGCGVRIMNGCGFPPRCPAVRSQRWSTTSGALASKRRSKTSASAANQSARLVRGSPAPSLAPIRVSTRPRITSTPSRRDARPLRSGRNLSQVTWTTTGACR